MLTGKSISGTRSQLIILLLLAFGLNFNTLFNEYAMDDVVVYTNNTLVKQGISAIPKIFTTDLFYGVGKKEVELAGGRYRPLELAVFAIEYQLFGQNPVISHLLNVLLFILLIGLLYKLLQVHLFKKQHPYLAFITCLVFVVHPVHTEVIANVKSRDELISFILILASAFSFIRFSERRSWDMLLSGATCFFLALLTRESAIPMIIVFPLVAYFFFEQSFKKSLLLLIPMIAVFIIYMVIRISVVGFDHSEGTEVMNFPFLYATPVQAFATKVFILLKYVWLLVFPYPLSCDYGYAEISYIGIGSWQFILSLLFFTGLLFYAVLTFRDRSLVSFCILYFLITISLFSNFIINIGSFLAERLLFQPSLAFCIIVAMIYINISRLFQLASAILLLEILTLFSLKTVLRNFEWKNDQILYFTDVKSAPNSVRTNFNAAAQYVTMGSTEHDLKLKEEYYKQAIHLDENVLKFYTHYFPVYSDLGFAYFGLHDYFKTADCWIQAAKMDTTVAAKNRINLIGETLYNEGNKYYKAGNIDTSMKCYKKSLEVNDKNVDAWHNLGLCYFKMNDIKNGIAAWENVKRLSSGYKFESEELSR